MNTILSVLNSHPYDSQILFEERGHIYNVKNDKNTYTSVTKLIHNQFSKFDSDAIIDKMMAGKKWDETHKYFGMTKKQIKDLWAKNGKEASSAGTKLHFDIETFMNNDIVEHPYTLKDLSEYSEKINNSSQEWKYFENFISIFPDLRPYRTEWIVYHPIYKIAGSIDMVFEQEDGTLDIYDWKRSKEITQENNFHKFSTNSLLHNIPDTNFWHYSLQLNIYKFILESRYGKKVNNLFLVRLHPDSQDYELIKVPDLQKTVLLLFP